MSSAQLALVAVTAPLIVSAALSRLLVGWAPRLGLVDQPGPRKVHSRPIPRAGGIAIFVAFAVTVGLLMALVGPDATGALPWLLIGGLAITVLGLADDLRPLPWQLRLTVQGGVAVAAAIWLVPPAPLWLKALAVVWIAGLVNAFNMLDNMDALSAGTAWIAALWLALITWQIGGPATAEWLTYVILLGATAGFLVWNRPPARIFMGDAGSTFLGFLLGVATARIALWQDGPAGGWAIAVCVTAAAWYDLVSVVTIRLSQGRSPFHADKQHLSHRLVARGLRPPVAVPVIHLLALASGAGGLIICLVTVPWGAAFVLGQLAVWWLGLAVIEFGGQKAPRSEQKPEECSEQGA